MARPRSTRHDLEVLDSHGLCDDEFASLAMFSDLSDSLRLTGAFRVPSFAISKQRCLNRLPGLNWLIGFVGVCLGCGGRIGRSKNSDGDFSHVK